MARARKAARGTSLLSSPPDSPPWERAIGAFLRLCEDSDAVLEHVADSVGCSRSAVVDALLRAVPEAHLIAIVENRLASDGDARAAWSRATR